MYEKNCARGGEVMTTAHEVFEKQYIHGTVTVFTGLKSIVGYLYLSSAIDVYSMSSISSASSLVVVIGG